MEPDTYKPILSVQVQPVNKSDWFTPGEHYVPRRLRSGAATRKSNCFMMAAFCSTMMIILSIFVDKNV